jgi:hypothetical protein
MAQGTQHFHDGTVAAQRKNGIDRIGPLRGMALGVTARGCAPQLQSAAGIRECADSSLDPFFTSARRGIRD